MAGFNMGAAPTTSGAGRPFRRALVAGASGGIGGGLLAALLAQGGTERVFALSRGVAPVPVAGAALPAAPGSDDPRVRWLHADLEDDGSLARAAGAVAADGGALDLVVIATGLLHGPGVRPERRLEDLDPAAMARVLAVNAVGPLLLARHLLPLMRQGGGGGEGRDTEPPPVMLVCSARVGSLADNRLGGWYAYRMGKAALNQGFRTLAVESRRRWPAVVVALYHPGTVMTRLSAPFAGGGQGPDHRRFTPMEAAQRCLDVVESLGPADHGGFFAWDGQTIPW